VLLLAATDPWTFWWAYVLLFLAVGASWAGLPFIGATALTAAAVGASQGKLDLAAVIVVSTVAGEVGGIIGYFVGDRWGRQLIERPGKHQAGRQKVVEKGEAAYAKWGRLAVFFTPAIVSGTAKMQRGQFIVWNFMASLAFTLSVAASTYGLGRVVTGHTSALDVGILLLGLLIGTALTVRSMRRHRRLHPTRPDPGPA
jgi:membrane protein DedA with SNARE-associated domain